VKGSQQWIVEELEEAVGAIQCYAMLAVVKIVDESDGSSESDSDSESVRMRCNPIEHIAEQDMANAFNTRCNRWTAYVHLYPYQRLIQQVRFT
jgi:hypothetical protein